MHATVGGSDRHRSALGHQPEGGTVPERVGIVLIALALGGEQHARPDQRGEVTEDVRLPPRIAELGPHPQVPTSPARSQVRPIGDRRNVFPPKVVPRMTSADAA